MTVLGLDVGEKRIGVAISDPTELLARPLHVLQRKSMVLDCAEIGRLAALQNARTIVVGVPLTDDIRLSDQARRTLAFIRSLRRVSGVPVVTWDERYSTVEAHHRQLSSGMGKAKRRATIDAAAAAVILDEWLDDQRSKRGKASHDASTNSTGEALC